VKDPLSSGVPIWHHCCHCVSAQQNALVLCMHEASNDRSCPPSAHVAYLVALRLLVTVSECVNAEAPKRCAALWFCFSVCCWRE
jgi:hypothetical protein